MNPIVPYTIQVTKFALILQQAQSLFIIFDSEANVVNLLNKPNNHFVYYGN